MKQRHIMQHKAMDTTSRSARRFTCQKAGPSTTRRNDCNRRGNLPQPKKTHACHGTTRAHPNWKGRKQNANHVRHKDDPRLPGEHLPRPQRGTRRQIPQTTGGSQTVLPQPQVTSGHREPLCKTQASRTDPSATRCKQPPHGITRSTHLGTAPKRPASFPPTRMSHSRRNQGRSWAKPALTAAPPCDPRHQTTTHR